MASIKISGMDRLAEELKNMGQLTGPLSDAMLRAGSVRMVERRKEEAERRGHRQTGQMIAKIAADRKVHQKQDGAKQITVYSRGTDKKGVRNAEKEFVLHYGSSKLEGDHWVDAANAKAEPEAIAAMERIFDEFAEKGK